MVSVKLSRGTTRLDVLVAHSMNPENIQHPTSNALSWGRPWMWDVGCWMFLSFYLVFFPRTACAERPVVLSPQLITLPADCSMPRFVDVDRDGRTDMLVIDRAAKTVWNYHQRPGGFTNAPDQIVPLAPGTAWVSPCDVDAHSGLELLMSMSNGLVYARQNAGLFESERRTLIEASQVFTNVDFPVLPLLSTNKTSTNDLVPVISERQAVLYHRNSAYEWSAGPPVTLSVAPARFSAERDWWGDQWTVGCNPAHSFGVYQSYRAKPEPRRDAEPENDSIRKILGNLKKENKTNPPHIEVVDVDGDGRQDLVLWQEHEMPALKCDVYIFLRGADQRLPEQPTQVLRCHGFPIPIGSTRQWSPVHDLNGDGICELVLLELKVSVLSVNGVIETFLSHGIDWELTIRTLRGGVFPGSPDAAVPVKGILPAQVLAGWSFFIQGDFNGDGRPDLLVRRSDTQWNIFFSSTDGRWFVSQPAVTFHTPLQGSMEISDLNGDGLADIVWHDLEKSSVCIYFSPSPPVKGGRP
jgi:hypothetical protein